MKKMGILVFICLMLSACAVETKKFSSSKNTEFMAMLSDPAIRKDFRQLKAVAMTANLYHLDGRVSFSKEDVAKLDAISAVLANRLRYDYHLNANHYKIHTFIGKYQPHSCYQYYNSYAKSEINKACNAFSPQFGSCQLCDNYLKAIHSRRLGIMHATWWNNENTVDLVDLFKLKNGDSVYMGLEISIS